MIVEAVVSVKLHAFVVRIEHEVDDTRDCIGTVNCGGATGEHIDALDKLRRDLVQVGRVGKAAWTGDPARAARIHAPVVDQHQGALRAEIAHTDRIDADGADGVARRGFRPN